MIVYTVAKYKLVFSPFSLTSGFSVISPSSVASGKADVALSRLTIRRNQKR